MKITKQQHESFVKTTFEPDEYPKILDWLDKRLAKYQPLTDPDIWRELVLAFKELKDGKKTKAFIYKMFLLNGMTSLDMNAKVGCHERRQAECPLIKDYAHLALTPRQEFDNVCSNLSICLLMPDKWDYSYSQKLPSIIEIDATIIGE